MSRIRTNAAVATAASLVAGIAVLVPSAAAAAPVKLVGTVGPGFTITLTQGGKQSRRIAAVQRQPGAGDRFQRQRPGADLTGAFNHRHLPSRLEPVCQRR